MGVNDKIEYPEDFVEECLFLFPHDRELERALEEGSYWVGQYLDDRCSNFSPHEVYTLCLSSPSELLKRSHDRLQAQILSRRWTDIWSKQVGFAKKSKYGNENK